MSTFDMSRPVGERSLDGVGPSPSPREDNDREGATAPAFDGFPQRVARCWQEPGSVSTSDVPIARLILVAHAATAATRGAAFPRFDDRSDPADLALAARMVLPESAETLASPHEAAGQTAKALGHAIRVEPALRDLDAGRWAGAPLATIVRAELADWIADPSFDRHGGETIMAFFARVRTFLADRHGSSGTTIAVTHGSVLRAALLATLDAPAHAFWQLDAPPLCTLTLSSDRRRWRLRSLETIPAKANDG